MATQYKDDSFSDIKPLVEAIDEFNEAVAVGADVDIREKLKEFEQRLSEFE